MKWLQKVIPALSPYRALLQADISESAILAIDLEMNSLDARSGQILSIGAVAIDRLCIRLDSARHWLIAGNDGVGESATIHGLRNIDCQQGLSLCQALEALLEMASSRVLLFHHAALDQDYLRRGCLGCKLPQLDTPVIDTLKLEQRRLERSGQTLKPDMLALDSCRQRYRLPAAPAHNALEDALSTAELFLVMARKMTLGKPGPVSHFVL